MASAATPLDVSPEQRRTLESWSRAHNTPRRLSIQALAILRAAEGRSNTAIADDLGVTRTSVIRVAKTVCH